MDRCGDKMADDGGQAGSGAGAVASTSRSGSEEVGGRDCSSGVPDLTPHSGRMMEEEMEQLLDQVGEVGRGLASIKSGRRKVTNPLLPYSVEVWEGRLLQVEEARDKLNQVITELRKCVSSEKQAEADHVSPFGIFPVEVWERILPHLMDSRDIENVLRAYPWLEGRVMKNKYSWLLDQVMPHIFPWLKTNDVLTCRQVCKRWNHGVDNFLENHPQKRGYDFGSPLTGQVWIPEASRAYYELGHRFRGWKSLDQWEQMEQFKKSMINHPPGRNVFVGRSVTFWRDWDSYADGEVAQEEYWEVAMEFLQTFGDHLWFVEIYEAYVYKEFGQFCDFLFQLLSLLPNLKSFHMSALEIITFDGSTVEALEILERCLQSFPQLPQLETLSMPCSGCGDPTVPDCLIKFLVMSSSNTLKRLRLCPCRCKWMVEVSSPARFPNLTEFSLLKCTAGKIVPVILRSLGAPNLVSLEVELARNEADFLDGRQLVSWSKLFPSLHSFKLSVFQCAYEDDDLSDVYPDELKMDCTKLSHDDSSSLCPLTDSVPSLTSLLFDKCDVMLEFDFLKGFPNLEYLKIHWSNLVPQSQYLTRARALLCGTGIWEMLHKLKEISLLYELENRYNAKWHFFRSREEYERLKQEMSDPILQELFEAPHSIQVRVERREHSSSEETASKQLLTSRDYEVKCIQLRVYTLTQAKTYRGKAKWSRYRDLSWTHALNFLRKHGDHVNRLEFESDLAGSFPEFYRLVFDVLSLLPNLKALEISGLDYCQFDLSVAQDLKLLLAQPSFPSLYHLETLKIHSNGLGQVAVPPGMITFLMKSCSETVKKLEVHHSDWVKIKDFVELPSLVELKMERFTEKSQVNEAFLSFKAPNLVSLDFSLRKETDELVAGGDIIPWLKYFPKLETCKLSIWDQDSSRDPKVKAERKNTIRECGVSSVAVPSLNYFRLEGCPHELSFEFLYCFPNLQNLELIAKDGHPFYAEDKLGGPGIWEKLPKLQKVTAFKNRDFSYYGKADFSKTRGQYESSKRAKVKPGRASNLNGSRAKYWRQ